jgi:pyruvate dehydrogenase E1 component alpha subunit
MYKSRIFEENVINLWNAGIISGEMHLGIGEEAISAGILSQIEEGDALALDHRGTPPLIMRGINPISILKELIGSPEGLCAGQGGHMHMFSRDFLCASSGIVGASAPAGVGFALSAKYLRPGKIAIAFFGEGAMNQGMVMESFNLASAWNLPLIFVCKDNKMAITTRSDSVTSGSLLKRAESFGLKCWEIDGSDVETVWQTAKQAINLTRTNRGPAFIHAHCFRPQGHFLGDPLIRNVNHPIKAMKEVGIPMVKSIIKKEGACLPERVKSLQNVSSILTDTFKNQFFKEKDPVKNLRNKLQSKKERLDKLEFEIKTEIEKDVSTALDKNIYENRE